MTAIRENARLELLRAYAAVRDFVQEAWRKDGARYAPEWTPLFAGEWENVEEDVLLALKEAVALGQMEAEWATERSPQIVRTLQSVQGPPCRITDAGYDFIRAHDAIGEASQEPLPAGGHAPPPPGTP